MSGNSRYLTTIWEITRICGQVSRTSVAEESDIYLSRRMLRLSHDGRAGRAFNLRSEREPLLQLGLFSNPLMVVWLAATLLFVLSISFVPVVQARLSTTGLTLGKWRRSALRRSLGPRWIEVAKRIKLAARGYTRLV
jgi:Cation transporting ATPase, C-terminus